MIHNKVARCRPPFQKLLSCNVSSFGIKQVDEVLAENPHEVIYTTSSISSRVICIDPVFTVGRGPIFIIFVKDPPCLGTSLYEFPRKSDCPYTQPFPTCAAYYYACRLHLFRPDATPITEHSCSDAAQLKLDTFLLLFSLHLNFDTS